VQNAVTARLDTVPTLLSLLSLLAYVRAADSQRTLDFALAGACCGLAVLAKGVFFAAIRRTKLSLTGPWITGWARLSAPAKIASSARSSLETCTVERMPCRS